MTDFAALLRLLTTSGVEFILVGGLAATVHGSARLTQDIDAVYNRSEENLLRLTAALAGQNPYPRGAPPGLPFQWNVVTIRRGLNFTLSTELGDLDLFGEIAGGGTYENLLAHIIQIRVFELEVLCLDLPCLIRVKRASGRPRDLEVVAELEAIWEEYD
ncbi:MAG: hypothetical protein ACR2L2_08435 [Acidobacteriota bacterium]